MKSPFTFDAPESEPERKVRFIPAGKRPQLPPEDDFPTILFETDLRRERDGFDSAIRRNCCYLFLFLAFAVLGYHGWLFVVEFALRVGRP